MVFCDDLADFRLSNIIPQDRLLDLVPPSGLVEHPALLKLWLNVSKVLFIRI